MRKKRFLSVVLAASMVFGSSVSAFASAQLSDGSKAEATTAPAKGSMKGSAQVEGYLNKDIFKVEVPTVSVNSSIFNFVMDPQGLIEATSGNRYRNNKGVAGVATSANDFEYGTLYFANVSGNNTKLSPTSDAITITNKSTFAVDATLTTAVNKFGELNISSNVAAATKPSIQLSLSGNLSANDGTTTSTPVAALGENGEAELFGTISGCNGDYVTSFNTSSNQYEYVLSSNSANFAKYSFKLTGASGGGDYTSWSAIEKATQKAQPEVTVTWNIVPYVTPVAPSITGTPTFTIPATGPIEIPLTLGAGSSAVKAITSISTGAGTVPAATYEYLDGILKLKRAAFDTLTASTIFTITFDNDNTKTLTFTVSP